MSREQKPQNLDSKTDELDLMTEFFVMCPPGLEKVTLLEVKRTLLGCGFELENWSEVRGGLEFSCPLCVGLHLNFYLKTAGRILMRIKAFQCKDFPRLFQRMKVIDWSQFTTGAPMDWEVSTHRSRLKMKKRIAQTAQKAYENYWQESNAQGNLESQESESGDLKRQKVFLRFNENRCTVSLDTTGPHLHQRGYRTHIGEAPIRENLAAGLIHLLAQADTNRYDQLLKQEVRLIDPMMGSGTLLFEAASLGQSVQRRFSFQDWPLTKKSKVLEPKPKFDPSPWPFQRAQFLGYEIDPKTFKAAELNLAQWQKQFQGPERLRFINEDVLKQGPEAEEPNKKVWMICNPPYQERVSLQGEGLDLKEALEYLAKTWQPEGMGMLLPAKFKKRIDLKPYGLRLIESFRLSNGGIPVIFWVWVR